MGSNYPQLDGTRCHVLVLFPERSWRSHLVEALHHPDTTAPVRAALCLRLLRLRLSAELPVVCLLVGHRYDTLALDVVH